MTTEQSRYDVIIVGAGMVGASIASELSCDRTVVLVEAEESPGYHATGRSAAVFSPSYGPEAISALTRGSASFFHNPPAGFTETPLLQERGALFVARPGEERELRTFFELLRDRKCPVELLDAQAVVDRVPVLNEQLVAGGVFDASTYDIEVELLLQGFLRTARKAGAELVTRSRLQSITCVDGLWTVTDQKDRCFSAPVIVNAAGAWCDELATLAGIPAVGLQPKRRSAFTFKGPDGLPVDDWPLAIALDESWYMKPDAGLLLGSPGNADPVPAHDVVAEELDVATGIYRIEEMTTLQIRRPEHTWAGLRSFVSDGEPVIGFESGVDGFFWASAVGGYGIQTAPAVGRLAAALVRGEDIPQDLKDEGLPLALINPNRDSLNRDALNSDA